MEKTKKVTLYLIGILAITLFLMMAYTKSHSPEAKWKFSTNGLKFEFSYCKPAKKGREIFGKLVPFNKVWRTGANEATIIQFDSDVQINNKHLKAGKYSLWTIPTATNWTIIFNAETGQWGTNYHAEHDVLKITVPSQKTNTIVESFNISAIQLDNNPDGILCELVLEWDKTQVKIPIK